MKWLGALINDVGGRGFVFAVLAFVITCLLAQFGSLDWTLWTDYNKWIGGGFLTAKAIEGGAAVLAGTHRKKDGG